MNYELVYVHYNNNLFGSVDEVTLEDLITAGKIKEFYRPSEKKWIDVSTGPLRIEKWQVNSVMRRASDSVQLKKYDPWSFVSASPQSHDLVQKQLELVTSEDWFNFGCECTLLEDQTGALMAYARSIQLNSFNKEAYVNRALLCEQIGNYTQAIDDYESALKLDPNDARLYYLCGLARKRLEQHGKAMEDFEKSARLGYVPALTEKCKAILGSSSF